ncbi:5-(carboxyamino)imidazole ribonucleotide synthase [Frigoriflavimonas asaccharolytica]|uniref:N5-carboxyaminoimidazole ribonucleotide synthase n=1 Tax=Frigoriflavimonas asaccharolytica TaxID=2735899 RepID=A0A8J8G778_9FLAO|nr:5-(carboxyamino)imidazole ribonucleotide synthase [Frigoriflavimonas asaccharolytica]NRS92773.1 5-(carboxyamino)imidazole ribonucleotide synthase [Frigoriflavimonas asaccharolytica]
MKIGILGGGQLGRMLIQSALKYDDEFYTLDPDENCSCANISHFTKGNFKDYETVLNFGKDKEVLSIEIEHVNADALSELEKVGIKVIPNANIIKIIQQKILQKEFYKNNNIPSPNFQIVQNKDEINFPFPFVQKLNTGGYDGKGVQIIKNEQDLDQFWDEPSVLEKLVDIDKELSIIIAKNERGEIKTFPITEMVADPILNLLDFNICPADISVEIQNEVESIAHQFISAAHSSGLFAIEFFLDKAGKVWVNETAPRLHNSGHQSQEGNANSQFEQYYRTLVNAPLADTDSFGFSGMLNLIGAENYTGEVFYEGLDQVMKMPKTYIHLYGKKTTKPGRKMGHINVLAETREDLIEKLILIKSLIKVISI